MRFKLASKIITAAVVTILLLGSIATLTVFYFVHKSVLDVEKDSLMVIAENSTLEISRVFTDTALVVKTIVSQPEIKSYFYNPVVQDENILRLLGRYNIGERSSSIYLISRSGETLLSTDPSFVGKNYSFRKYFQDALAGEDTIDMAIGVTTNEPGYYISSPVRDNEENIAGVLVVKLKPETVHNLISSSGLSDFGHVMFVDDYGVIIYSDQKDRVYKSLGGLDTFERLEIEKKQKYPNQQITALEYDLILDQIRFGKKKGVLDIYDKRDKKKEILAYSQVGDYPFYLVYEEENDDFALSAFRVSFVLSLFVFASAILAIIIITITARRFLKPMGRIVDSLKRISSGDIDTRIDLKTGDEFEELSRVFNDMLDKIKEARDGVEKKVEQRTSELEKFNSLMIGRELRMVELKEENNDLRKGLEKKSVKDWGERFSSGLNYEEEIIRQLESVYLYKIKASSLPKIKKDKIKKLLNKLIEDSKKHNEMFRKLAKKHEKNR